MGKFIDLCCEKQNPKVVNGEFEPLGAFGSISSVFNSNSVSDVMVTNITTGVIKIEYTTLFSPTGNSIFYCASGQTVHINTKDNTDLISKIVITEITGGAGNIIINATRI